MDNAVVVIPAGKARIALMRILPFQHPSYENPKDSDCNGFPLYRYDNIGTLVIPESISIPP